MQNLHFSAPAEFLKIWVPAGTQILSFQKRCSLVCHTKERAVQTPKARVLRLCLEGGMHWWHEQKFLPGCPTPFLNVHALTSATCSSPSSVYRRNPAGSCLWLPEVRSVLVVDFLRLGGLWLFFSAHNFQMHCISEGYHSLGTPGLVAHVKHTTLSHTGSQGPGMLWWLAQTSRGSCWGHFYTTVSCGFG